MKSLKLAALALLASSALVAPALAQDHAKNIIVLITDGAGPESWNAASYYRHGALGHEAYDGFDLKAYMATHPLNTSSEPTFSDEGSVTFDPTELWTDTAVDTVYEGALGNYAGYFSGYDYARADYTDSAAAATALASGQKTYNNSINWSNNGESLRHIGEYAVESGRALGVVSSVQISHATPAGYLAHNVSRNDYVAIGTEIVDSGLATVVLGTGHPMFDAAGKPVAEPADGAFRYIGGRDTFARLTAGETDYQFIETREDFEALANGTFEMTGDKILGLVQNNATLQFNRPGVGFGDLLENSPSLPTLTAAALNVLAKDEDGFFLMVEGGAVDWAAHANNLPRLIEEQIDFNMAIETAVKWVEANSNWDETLIIVTTDHGNGLLAGPQSDTIAYQPIVNQGQGAMPLVRWHSDTHTRELVPLFAHGAGSEYFRTNAAAEAGLARYGVDEAAQIWVDNTDIFHGAMAAMGIEEVAAN
ncbi:alkaline phosphatase (plasmid) [Ketogulonicigenium robustum]|uniref:Alkaline phosphatase n=1 Tax=Ketogulonicigenium robustum TaxID=92947 RepID=A0A1W6P330_9RHOB|nr:alkaline phosphatase [Ketogulonicigenium robustum]ARO15839.1 alkaline phosphatase [Ketogulonicigenium robustum]